MNLNVQISKLRHILDEGRAQGSCIQTITGYGYRFVEGGPRLEPHHQAPLLAMITASPIKLSR